jgi:hypothetical protein
MRISNLEIQDVLHSCEEYSPEQTDLFAGGVSLLEHQTGMDSCKNKFSVSGTRNKVEVFHTVTTKQFKLQALN